MYGKYQIPIAYNSDFIRQTFALPMIWLNQLSLCLFSDGLKMLCLTL